MTSYSIAQTSPVPISRPLKVKQEGDDDASPPDATGWSASLYNKNASFVYSSPFVAPVLALLNAQPGEQILDLGCGSGEVSLDIERVVCQRPEGLLVGVDYSESMVSCMLDPAVSINCLNLLVQLVLADPESKGEWTAACVCRRHPGAER